MSVNSEYRCPDCREPVRQFFNPSSRQRGHSRIGVKHAPTCKYIQRIASRYPKLVERIEKERSAA